MGVLEQIARGITGTLSLAALVAGAFFLGRATLDWLQNPPAVRQIMGVADTAIIGVGWILVGLFIQVVLSNAIVRSISVGAEQTRGMLARIGKLLQR